MTDPIIDAAETAVPVIGEIKAGLTIAQALWPLLAGLGLAGAVGAGFLYVRHLEADRDAWKAQADVNHKQDQRDVAQSVAGQSALKIVADGAVKQQLTVRLEQDHAQAIAQTPGAAQALDPRLNDTGRRSLCAYDAYADNPGCAGLRRPDLGTGPSAGQGNAAPAR